MESLDALQINDSKQHEWLIGNAEKMAFNQNAYVNKMGIFACFCY